MTDSEINKKFFRKLIERYLDGLTTAEELKLLINYYESFQKNNEWVEELGPENIIKERMLINILDAIKDEDSKSQKVISLFNRKIVKYAAVASVAIFMAFYFFPNNNNQNPETINTVVNSSIEGGTNKATLTREDGSNIALEKGKNYNSDYVVSNGEELVYSKTNNSEKEIAYNYLTIPRGGQFFVKLADGTQVWLNSESKIKYPVSFEDGKRRIVELLYGEAYFDVSPSTQHKGSKFIVTKDNHEIEVLGTEFNIKAYNDEPDIVTTLVHGKINVNYQDKKYLLLPDQQSNLNRNSNTISFQTVDVYYETSWKMGVFSFQNKSLKDIMKVLARWYDFKVEFKNIKVESELFIGTLGKDDRIEDILKNLKELGIINGFEFKDKKIIIE